MVSAYSDRAGGNQETPSPDHSHARRSPTPALLVPLRPLLAAPATPAAALVEDKPSGSGTKRRKVQVDPFVRDWFLDMSHQWKTQRRWGMQQCLCEVQRLYSGMFNGINPNTPCRWKWSAPRAALPGRKTLLSLADMTWLSEHIVRVTDVLCLSTLTSPGLVLDWLDAEGHDVRPGREWARRLLYGMRLSYKKLAKCVKELHSPEQQHAKTHRLFIKLCWLMSLGGFWIHFSPSHGLADSFFDSVAGRCNETFCSKRSVNFFMRTCANEMKPIAGPQDIKEDLDELRLCFLSAAARRKLFFPNGSPQSISSNPTGHDLATLCTNVV